MRNRRVVLAVAVLLVGLTASSVVAQQATKRLEQEAFLLGGWAADAALRFDPFSLTTLPATKARSDSAVTPSAAPVPVSAVAPSPTPTVSPAATPPGGEIASSPEEPVDVSTLRPPIRVPYRPPLRSPFKPPWP